MRILRPDPMKSTQAFRYLLLVFAGSLLLPAATRSAELGVDRSGRFLTLEGKPFFWLGDTVWLLAQLPSNDDLESYLKTRAEQGFTVIQLTAVMAEERVWGTLRTSSRGDAPFIDGDVLRPAVTPGKDATDPDQYDYWDHLDYVLERVHAHGFRAALVTYFVGWQGEGYKYLTPEKAHAYGLFLGQRYRGKPEIVWVLGGDNTPDTEEKKSVWTRLARGLAEGLTGSEDYGSVLMTYHINGGASSAQLWHESPWLDFNMAQTWSEYGKIYPAVLSDYQRTPIRPCGLGEGAYEDGPQYPTKPINAVVIRKQACWSYFAGGYHTYGNGNVWHFDSLKAELTQSWKEALRSSGAETLHHAKQFLNQVRWWEYVPDPTLFVEGQGAAASLNVVMRTREGDSMVAYICSPVGIRFHLDRLTMGNRLSARWVNAASGEEQSVSVTDHDAHRFTLPDGWEDGFLHIRRAD
jgi:hypothetical protein